MKKGLLVLGAAALLAVPQLVNAEGFAVNEWSAEGVAMGGARMFAEGDAANLAYNPASITKIDGKANKVVATYISPHGEYTAVPKDGIMDGSKPAGIEEGHNRIHPAWVPGHYYVKQISENEWIGIGTVTRFGLVSQFPKNSLAATNSSSAKLAGMSMNPTYARKLDDKWSVAVGAEINYIGLKLDKQLLVPAAGNNLAGPRVNLHIKGDSYALGWNAAANYQFDEKNEMGVVYHSKIDHSVDADVRTVTPLGEINSTGYGCVTLPDSWAIGYNHKFDDKTRVELNGTYTRWSTYDRLDMKFHNNPLLPSFVPSYKGWSNGWRYAIGVEHELSDKYSVMSGFAYDESSVPSDGGDFMVPTGKRVTYSIGGQYHDEKQTVALAVGYMKVGDLDFGGGTDPLYPGASNSDGYKSVHSHDSFSKIVSVSYQYNF